MHPETHVWSKVEKTPDGCWLWTGRRYWDGYGEFTHANGKRQAAHRVAWEATNGRPVATGFLICHTCDNRPCVNPAHLFEGTQSDNMKDMVAKGRHGGTDSEAARAALAVLTEADVAEIRRKCVNPAVSYAALARDLGVSPTTVRDAATGRKWAHILFAEVVPPRSRSNAGRKGRGIVDGRLLCGRCNTAKPVAEFSPSIAAKGHGWCRVCASAWSNQRYHARKAAP